MASYSRTDTCQKSKTSKPLDDDFLLEFPPQLDETDFGDLVRLTYKYEQPALVFKLTPQPVEPMVQAQPENPLLMLRFIVWNFPSRHNTSKCSSYTSSSSYCLIQSFLPIYLAICPSWLSLHALNGPQSRRIATSSCILSKWVWRNGGGGGGGD